MSEVVANVGLPEIEITPDMIKAGAEELWDWVLRSGYDDTYSVVVAMEPAEAILRAALHRKLCS